MILYPCPEPDMRDPFTPDQMRESLLMALRQHLATVGPTAERLIHDPGRLEDVPDFARAGLVKQLAMVAHLAALLVRYHDLGGHP